MAVTRQYHDALPAALRRRLAATVADRLEPITQKHQIDRLISDYG